MQTEQTTTSYGRRMIMPCLFNGVDEDLPVAGWRHHYIYGKADVPDDVVRAILTALEDERILDNAQSFSYSALRPNLVRGVRLHRATEERFARR